MPWKDVNVFGDIPVPPELVWSLVRNFCGKWHPAISTMKAEQDKSGRLIRVFTVHGQDTVYRERLTWFSDSDRSMSYTHVDGIQGVEAYNAQLLVSGNKDGGARVTMTAKLLAPDSRDEEVATGTKEIFDEAIIEIKKLAKLSMPTYVSHKTNFAHDTPIQTYTFGETPRLAISHIGEPSETLCLFLHGIGGNKSNWNQQLTSVAPYVQSAALDLRGYGESTLGAIQSNVDEYCDDILSVADRLGALNLVLCGLSYGSWIATSFAMRYPNRLSALVLSGGCTGMSEAPPEEREAFRLSREVPIREGKTPADFSEDLVAVISGPDASNTVKRELLTSMQAISTETYVDALKCFTSPFEKFDFSKITMPVLLMTGEHDKLAPPEEIRGVAKRIFETAPEPDVRFECLAGAGHVCNLENPNAYNSALVEFIMRVVK